MPDVETEEYKQIMQAIIHNPNSERAMFNILNKCKLLSEPDQILLMLELSKSLNAPETIIKQINARELIKLKIWFAKTAVLFAFSGIIVLCIIMVIHGDIKQITDFIKNITEISSTVINGK